MSTQTVAPARPVATPDVTTETAQQAGARVHAKLIDNLDEYREFGILPVVMDRLATLTGLTADELHNLYSAYLDASDARDDMEWTGRKPWDDAAELQYQAAVHGYTDELTRVLRHHGYTGRVTADRLSDLS